MKSLTVFFIVVAFAATLSGALSNKVYVPLALQEGRGYEVVGPLDNYTCTADGAFPHEEECILFVECWSGAATLFQCTEVMLFDLRYMGCNWAEYTDCGDRRRPPDYPTPTPSISTTTTTVDPSAPTYPTTPPPNSTFVCPSNGVFPHEEKCEYYWSCFEGEAQLIHCELDYLYDLRYNGCNFPQYVDCGDRERPPGAVSTVTPPETTRPTTPEVTGPTEPGNNSTTSSPKPGFQCPKPEGTFPDPEDCAGFYVCIANTPIHEVCPDGLHFDPNKGVCDWPDVVQCEI